MVLDAQKVNALTKPETLIPPSCQEVMSTMYNSKIFSLIDIKQAYHGIRLEESSRQYTCFTTFKGNYEFNLCVFGMLNSQAALCRTMSKVLAGVLGKNIHIYIDDLIIHSTTVEHHLNQFAGALPLGRSGGIGHQK